MATESRHTESNPLIDALLTLTARGIDAKSPVPWHQLPPWAGVLALLAFRTDLQQNNLFDAPALDGVSTPPRPEYGPTGHRTADGSFNDPEKPEMGQAGMPFGYNMKPAALKGETTDGDLLSPNPREISERLLARTKFQPAPVNLLAAAWIQFQVHGWFSHDVTDDEPVEIPSPDGRRGESMKVKRTLEAGRTANGLPVYRNGETHWWDASQVYGSSQERQDQLRSHECGKLHIDDNGLLPLEADMFVATKELPAAVPRPGVDLTGFNKNYWVGLSLLHTLFAREHNAICERLQSEHPDWNDEQLFQTARLINSALMAKIHTVEWTPGILNHDAIKIALNGNWSGVLSETIRKALDREVSSDALDGIVGGNAEHFGADFAMTEEFVSVYRMHPLIPDEVTILNEDGTEGRTYQFQQIQGSATRDVVDNESMLNLLHSFGVARAGSIALHNFPQSLREFQMPDGSVVDLGAVDILRDRERGVPRYNKFREMLRLKPVPSFDALTGGLALAAQARQLVDDGTISSQIFAMLEREAQYRQQLAREIEDVYDGDINKVDLMVGLYAERPPRGFGFCDTTFRIFILMASRRLKSDRFYTDSYNAETYTETGMQWIAENTMATVLLRHHPELENMGINRDNAFAPWKTAAPVAD